MLSTYLADCRRLIRRALELAIVGSFLLAPSAARAWGEKRVESSTTSIELAADGSASVRHELVLEVRGAPLTQLTLRGVDADAEPLPDATLTRLPRGPAAGPPEPVLVQAHAGQLDMSVRSPRGLRGRSFLLRVGYRTRLAGAVRPLPDGQRFELSWVGPRFDDGVDAVTLILRTRATELPPEVAPEEGSGPGFGMVMSSLRRSRDLDELELVRAHVARDEAIRWNIRLDRTLLGAGAEGNPTGQEPSAALAAPLAPVRERPAPDSTALRVGESPNANWPIGTSGGHEGLGLAAASVAYALLVWLKARLVTAASTLRGCTPLPWIGWSPPWRALLAGAAVGTAGALWIGGQSPLLGALGLLLAMACGAHHRPREAVELRGPGEWRAIEPNALEPTARVPLPGAWLDAGRARGFLLMLTALGAIGAIAARVFDASPYLGACLLLSSCVLLPLFCTGRAGELPPDTLGQARELLGDVARRLARDATLVVKPIGRIAAASGELDELRLSLASVRPVPGLLGIELGIERRELLGGQSLGPALVVRAAEGSECQRRLPRGITWMRGRNADERASVIRPKLPHAATCVALIQELWTLLSTVPEPAAKNAAKSSGSGLATANGGTRSSPAHAT